MERPKIVGRNLPVDGLLDHLPPEDRPETDVFVPVSSLLQVIDWVIENVESDTVKEELDLLSQRIIGDCFPIAAAADGLTPEDEEYKLLVSLGFFPSPVA